MKSFMEYITEKKEYKVIYSKDGFDFIENPVKHVGKKATTGSYDAAVASDEKQFRAYKDDWVDYDREPAGIQRVKIADIRSFQSMIYKPSEDFQVSDKPVKVNRLGKKLFLMDGNHRVAHAIMNGEKYIKARVIDLVEE